MPSQRNFGQSVVRPQLLDALRRLQSETMKVINCVKVGQINRFDGTKKTAEVQILFKRVLPGDQVVSYPVLVDVPVFTLQGGGVAVQMPVTAGDQCLVLFSDRNLDIWFKNGAEAAPLNDRTHDLSDGIALVGLNALNSTLPNYPTDEARILAGNAKVAVKKDGSEAALKYSTTNKVAVDSSKATMVQGSAEVTATGNKVRVKNGVTDLLTAIDGLIDVLEALTIQDPVSGPIPLTAASIAALEAQKTVFAGFLTT